MIPLFNLKLGTRMALRDKRAPSQAHSHPRNPDPSSSRSHGDLTDMVGDVWHQLAKEQLIPAIANRTRNAVMVDRREVFFYQRLRSGRRCSCWLGTETSPHSECPICLSTGWAGGYSKWGTNTYLFDPTRQWFGVNVRINPNWGNPPWFSLEEGKTTGYLEWDELMLQNPYYGLDSSRIEYRHGDGSIEFKFKLDGYDTSFIPYSEKALADRILLAGCRRFRFRVYFNRQLSEDESPLFQQFWFRTLVDQERIPPVLYVDMPRRNESNMLAEYGALETYQTIQLVFTDVIQRVNLEDLVVRLCDMTRWKITEASPNDPLNILTSHDVQVRKVYQHEALWSVPL